MPPRSLLLVPSLLVLQAGLVQLHSAQVEYFLKIDGITGESTDKSHPGWIEIGSFSWGVSNTLTITSSTSGAGAGKVSLSGLKVTKPIDKATPSLLRACASGKHIDYAELDVVVASGDLKLESPQSLLTLKLDDVALVNVTEGGAGGHSVPTESLDIVASRVELPAVQTPGAAASDDGFTDLTLSDAVDGGN